MPTSARLTARRNSGSSRRTTIRKARTRSRPAGSPAHSRRIAQHDCVMTSRSPANASARPSCTAAAPSSGLPTGTIVAVALGNVECGAQRPLGRRADDDGDTAILEVPDTLHRRFRAHGKRSAIDEDRHAEVHALHARQRDRRRAAFGVGATRGDGVNARIAIDGDPLHVELRQLQRPLDVRRDTRAQLDAVAAHLAVAILERKRAGAFPIREHYCVSITNTLERRRRERRRSTPALPSR